MARWAGARWDPVGNDGGSMVDGYAWRGLLHTTEGKTYAGARAVYVARNVQPHFTVSYEGGRFQAWQHIDTARAARALRNPTGGVQTNRGHAIQVEIVGTCNPANKSWGTQFVEAFPRGYLDGIARLMRWVEATHGIKRAAVSRWKAYPASFGAGNGIRIPAADWPSFNGWCGHQHAPENLHGDPGLIDIGYLLGATPPPPQEDDMTPEEVRAIIRDENERLYRLLARGVDMETGQVSSAHQHDSLAAIADAIDTLEPATPPPPA